MPVVQQSLLGLRLIPKAAHKHCRCCRRRNLLAGTDSLRKLYYGLYLNIIFLYIRNIFRFIEFLQASGNQALLACSCRIRSSCAVAPSGSKVWAEGAV